MSSLVSEKHSTSSKEHNDDQGNTITESGHQYQVGDGENNPAIRVTSHLRLKPDHSDGTLDREAVLRRIRHRKRVNNVKKAFQALVSYPFSSKNADNNKAKSSTTQTIKWADDAFAAP